VDEVLAIALVPPAEEPPRPEPVPPPREIAVQVDKTVRPRAGRAPRV